MAVKVRFAPSPTGKLHVGNIFVALHNWLFARHADGRFLLRLDDTDKERSTAEFATQIQEDLTWLGLAWDEFQRQAAGLQRYDGATEKMKSIGRLYPCYESAEELALKRKVQLGQGRPPIYDRAALSLSDADRQRLEAEGRRPHWRFKLEPRRVEWHDLVRGLQHIEETSQSDPVLVREDGNYLYTLTSVVDDIAFGITHVIRGNDHVTNTATQIQIFEAMDAAVPVFAHLPLLVDAAGEGLSKRLGSLSIASLREEGLEPMAINAYLAHVGSGEPARPVNDLAPLAASHDLKNFGKTSPRFDPKELRHLNARLVHALPHDAALGHLKALGLDGIDAELWDAARHNVEKIEDIALWHRICRGRIEPRIVDSDFARVAADLLPGEPWSGETWSEWTEAVRQTSGRKGKALFMPLRLALTGEDHGPEMKLLLPLIGRPKAQARLRGESA